MNSAEYYQLNKHKYNTPEAQARRKAYREQNKQRNSEYQKEYNKEYSKKESTKVKCRQRYQENKTRLNEMAYERVRKKLASDPIFRLEFKLRRRYSDKLKLYKGVKKSLKTDDILGCTVAELKCYIESLWQPGMTCCIT